FISKVGGREAFLGERIPLAPGLLVTNQGEEVGRVASLELVTVGQRRRLGLGNGARAERRYVVGVDLAARTATLGPLEDLLVQRIRVADLRWGDLPVPPGSAVTVQLSAHGQPLPGRWEAGQRGAKRDGSGEDGSGEDGSGEVVLDQPARRAAAGQAVVLYGAGAGTDDVVLGGGTAL
ncbi:MAG: tRNA methyl transferase PRC-barrel domain-containing protein, partial [Acidimicrobiales bacterium]